MSSVESVLALLIALPILAAVLPIAFGVRWDRVGWSVAAVVCCVEFVLAVLLAVAVFVGDGFGVAALAGEGRVTHPLAGYERPIGIELVADELSAILAILVTGVATAVLAFARRAGPRTNAFYTGYLLLTAGLLGVTLTGDMFNMFVFLEITGLSTYALIASDRSGESAVAALQYLIIGTVGASLFLVGIGYAFVSTGTLNMIDLSAALAGETEQIAEPLYTDPLVLASFGFIAVGLMIKAAIFPLHTWQPDAYAAAPDTVTAYISGLVSTVAVYALARVSFTVFTVEFFAVNPLVRDVLLTMATVSIVAGSALAVMQSRVKRMFAYSSVSQFGIVVAAFLLGSESPTALYGGVVHLIGHGIMKTGLFVAAGVLAAAVGARTVDDYAGLARRAPYTTGALAVLGLSLVGVPPSVGFVGKWYIALGAVEAGVWPVAAVIVASTVLTLTYVARLLEKLYFTPLDADLERRDVGGARPLAPGDESLATDGGYAIRSDSVSIGMIAVALLAALLAVALGFAGWEFQQLLEPFVAEAIDA